MSERLKNIIRIGIGAVFVIAAILKLLSIDEFEMYIYSFNVFNFLVTTFVARIIIAAEILLGFFLIFNLYYRSTWKVSVLTLIFFTVFLIYLLLFRNDDNCHCFGDIIEMSPLQSVGKNLIMLFLLFLVRDKNENKSNKILTVIFCAISFFVSFVLLPADSIYNMIYSSDDNISSIDLYESFGEVDKIVFEGDSLVIDTTAVFNLESKNEIIAVVSSGCKYCKIGLKKLSMIMKRQEIAPEKLNIFIWGSEKGISRFRQETLTEDYDFWHIMPNKAIDVCLGKFPTFIWLEDAEVTKVGDLRAIDDNLEL